MIDPQNPAIAAWLFANGESDPLIVESVRLALRRALTADRENPLHYCLGIPRSGKAWRIYCRDVFLRRAAMALPARYACARQVALRMAEVVPAFFVAAPVWKLYGVPSSATEFERLLYQAWATGIHSPKSLRAFERIIAA